MSYGLNVEMHKQVRTHASLIFTRLSFSKVPNLLIVCIIIESKSI